MKLVILSALLISCLASTSVLSAQDSLLQSEIQKLVNSLIDDSSVSSEQKIKRYKALLQQENNKSDINNLLVLILNEVIVREMGKIGDYAKIKAIFETSEFLKDINKDKENIHFYVDFLAATANAYLKLQEYAGAKKVIVELETYLSLYDLTDMVKARVLVLAGQLHIMTGEYKEGLAKFRLTIEVVEKSTSFSDLNKLKRLSSALGNISNTYHILGDYKNAIKYNNRAIENSGNSLDPKHMVVYKHNIASSYLELLEWDKALNTATLASQQAKEIDRNIYFAQSNEVIARALHGLGKCAEAIEMTRTSIDTYKKTITPKR